MELIIIAAVAENRVIGRDGKVPWHISEDLQRFKQLTLHHPVIMGRKTWESIPQKYRPLPERLNIVLTRQAGYRAEGAAAFSSLEDALEYVRGVEAVNPVSGEIKYSPAFVIGGQQVYEQALPLAQQLEITELHQRYQGDAYFPAFSTEEWKEKSRVSRGNYSFVTYRRK